MEKRIKNHDYGKNKVRLQLEPDVNGVVSVMDDSANTYNFYYDSSKQKLLIVDCERCEEFIIKTT